MNLNRRSFLKAIPAALIVPSLAPGEDLFMPVYEPIMEEPKPFVVQHFLRLDFWPADTYPRLRDRRTLEHHYRSEIELSFARQHGVDIRSEMLWKFLAQCGHGLYQITEGVVLSSGRKDQTGQFRLFYNGNKHWSYPLEDHWVIRAVHSFQIRAEAGKVIQRELEDKIINFLTGIE